MTIRLSITATLLLVFCISPTFALDPAALVKKAQSLKPETCGNIKSIDQCHEDYLTGCTASERPRYDAYLNFLKNQTPKPTVVPVKTLTRLKEFTELDDHMPDDLKPGHNAEHAEELAALGQGRIHAVVGFLYLVIVSGAESTNCQLDGEGETDYHIHIGFDAAAAKRLREGWRPTKAETHELQQTSVIVEMTPHYRKWHQPTWSDDALAPLVGRQVKVVGLLLADNEHAKAKDSCAHPNRDKRCWRGSIWEIHPVTEFYVCGPSGDATCSATSPEWRKLKDMQ